MAYQGETLNACGLIEIDLSKIYIVAVNGSGPNICGHLLLYTPSRGGYYFHIAEVVGYPHYMTENGFRRYRKENHKKVLRYLPMTLPNPRGAEAYLEEVMSNQWIWLGIPHNCVAFCEEVIRAGGSQWYSITNCPALAVDVPEQIVNNFFIQLEQEILSQYSYTY